MKDINGNEFKVGCVIGINEDEYLREVTKILQDGRLVTWSDHYDVDRVWDEDILKRAAARILHYRELALDKNGKMLCEGDTVDRTSYKNAIVQGMAGKYFIVEYEPGEFVWTTQDYITFVSRPTDMSIKSAEATKLEQLIKEAKESWHKLDEALKKAEEAGLCN